MTTDYTRTIDLTMDDCNRYGTFAALKWRKLYDSGVDSAWYAVSKTWYAMESYIASNYCDTPEYVEGLEKMRKSIEVLIAGMPDNVREVSAI